MALIDQLTVLHEDNTILVLNKPAGLVVNRAESQKADTLEAWLEQEKGIRATRAGIVHRLDKDTSGIIVVAKDEAALTALQQQFQARTVKKQYVALVHGALAGQEGTIAQPLSRNPYNRTKFAVIESGRAAETKWVLADRYRLLLRTLDISLNKNQLRYFSQQAQDYTLINVFPKTGRTHQIRVHLLSLRHPIVSDTVYTSRKLLRFDVLWCPRLFLHASSLQFGHPKTGDRLVFTVPLPSDLQQALKKLEKIS